MKDKRDEGKKLEKQKKKKNSKNLSSKAKGKEKEKNDFSKKISDKFESINTALRTWKLEKPSPMSNRVVFYTVRCKLVTLISSNLNSF